MFSMKGLPMNDLRCWDNKKANDKRDEAMFMAGHTVVKFLNGASIERVEIFEIHPSNILDRERTWAGTCWDTGLDPTTRQATDAAGKLAESVELEAVVRENYSSELVDKTLAMLKDNWTAVIAIAQQLEESGEISGEQVSTIISPQPDSKWGSGYLFGET